MDVRTCVAGMDFGACGLRIYDLEGTEIAYLQQTATCYFFTRFSLMTSTTTAQENSQIIGSGGGGYLMRTAYAVHGAIVPFLPTALHLSPESKQIIRRWIVRADDAMSLSSSCQNYCAMALLMADNNNMAFLPGAEELISHSNRNHED